MSLDVTVEEDQGEEMVSKSKDISKRRQLPWTKEQELALMTTVYLRKAHKDTKKWVIVAADLLFD